MTFATDCTEAIFSARALAAKHQKPFTKADVAYVICEMYKTYHPPMDDKPKRKTPVRPPKLADDEAFLLALESDPTYQGIDIRRELGKCQMWASVNHCVPTRRRFVNWLNNPHVEKAIRVNGAGQSSFSRKTNGNGVPEPIGWQAWVDANRPESVYASNNPKGLTPWHQVDPTAQNYISEQMKPKIQITPA